MAADTTAAAENKAASSTAMFLLSLTPKRPTSFPSSVVLCKTAGELLLLELQLLLLELQLLLLLLLLASLLLGC